MFGGVSGVFVGARQALAKRFSSPYVVPESLQIGGLGLP